MKVKVGDSWYDGEKQPIAVYFTEQDKENLQSFFSNHTEMSTYGQQPEESDMDEEQFRQWLRE